MGLDIIFKLALSTKLYNILNKLIKDWLIYWFRSDYCIHDVIMERDE